MVTMRKLLEAGGFEGLNNHTQMNTDSIPYVLPMTADYLLECAYGPYMLTVSRRTEETARMMALFAYASHIRALPLVFSAWTASTADCVMVQAVSLLLPSGVLTIGTVPNLSKARRVPVLSNVVDQGIDTLLDTQLMPSRARMDAGYVRRRIARSADMNRSRILEAGERGGAIIRTLGALAGVPWPQAAARLTEGGVL